MPSVTMNDGRRQATVTAPLIAPTTTPVSIASSVAGSSDQFHCSIAMPAMAAASAIVEPTDRSMPAMISTKVMPTAVTATAGMSLAIVTNVSLVKKYSLCQLKKPIISASATSSPATVPIALVIAERVVTGLG